MHPHARSTVVDGAPTDARRRPTMIENEPITISLDDVSAANQLSLHCPICANPVENHVGEAVLRPVLCKNCGTLYHKACWEQSGGKCAILGCGSKEYRPYGSPEGPVMKISYADLPQEPRGMSEARQKRLKAEERRRAQEQTWARIASWFRQLLRAIKILE